LEPHWIIPILMGRSVCRFLNPEKLLPDRSPTVYRIAKPTKRRSLLSVSRLLLLVSEKLSNPKRELKCPISQAVGQVNSENRSVVNLGEAYPAPYAKRGIEGWLSLGWIPGCSCFGKEGTGEDIERVGFEDGPIFQIAENASRAVKPARSISSEAIIEAQEQLRCVFGLVEGIGA